MDLLWFSTRSPFPLFHSQLSTLGPLASLRLALAGGGLTHAVTLLLRHLAPSVAAAATAAVGGSAATAAAARAAAAQLTAAGLDPTPGAATAVLLGVTRHAWRAAAVGAAAGACLLAWPLAQRCAAVVAPRRGRSRRRGLQLATAVTLTRDIIIAPLTEEWAFRGCLLPLAIIRGGAPPAAAAAASAATFAAAHLHHAVAVLANPASSPALRRRAGAAAGLQLAYTLPFGVLAAALTLHTGSPAAAFTAHAVANVAGLPSLAKGAPGGRGATVVGAVGVAAFFVGAVTGVGRGPGATAWAATAAALKAA